MSSKLLVPVALGVSLVTVTAFVVYYVFKKDDEDEHSSKVKTTRINTIEVKVPKSITPVVIGKRSCICFLHLNHCLIRIIGK